MGGSLVLTAVYDFQVSGVSFDFLSFLVLSETACREQGADGVHMVLAMGEGDGFHANPLYDLEQKQWRLRNIVMPLCWMVPSVSRLTVCATREELRAVLETAGRPVFPEGYAPDAPTTINHIGWVSLKSLDGIEVQWLRASDQARYYARQWLAAHNRDGRQNIILTLREATFHPQRNTDLSLWLGLCRHLHESGYNPIVIRDVEKAHEPLPPGNEYIQIAPAAAFNLDLRLALYEEAHLHISVNQGAASMALFDREVRFLHFMAPDAVTGEAFRWAGLRRGAGFPFLNRFQMLCWEAQTEQTLREQADRVLSLLAETKSNDLPARCMEPDPANREPMRGIAIRYFDTDELDLFAAASERHLASYPDDFHIHYLLALAELRKQEVRRNGNHDRCEAHLRRSLEIIDGLKPPLPDNVTELRQELLRLIG